MKEWNKPQLFILGVDKTTEDTPTTLTPKPHKGYCHRTVGDCTGPVNDHSDAGSSSGKGHGYTGVPCPTHGPGNEACCCYKAPEQS